MSRNSSTPAQPDPVIEARAKRLEALFQQSKGTPPNGHATAMIITLPGEASDLLLKKIPLIPVAVRDALGYTGYDITPLIKNQTTRTIGLTFNNTAHISTFFRTFAAELTDVNVTLLEEGSKQAGLPGYTDILKQAAPDNGNKQRDF